jgi:hypothetical protein
MTKKDFGCKAEEVPAIAGYVTNSLRNDMADFSAYSPIFSNSFLDSMENQRNVCSELLKTTSIVGQMKLVTQQMIQKSLTLRSMLNLTEGYLVLAKSKLDMQVKDFGLKALRKKINQENFEGVIADSTTLISNLRRNQASLELVGMKNSFTDDLSNVQTEISHLNEMQNGKMSERSRLSDANIKEFNKLWGKISMITKSARAIYRGVDEVKLKDYTLSKLIKKARNANNKDQNKPSDPQTAATD